MKRFLLSFWPLLFLLVIEAVLLAVTVTTPGGRTYQFSLFAFVDVCQLVGACLSYRRRGLLERQLEALKAERRKILTEFFEA
jgi:hypothetical protein